MKSSRRVLNEWLLEVGPDAILVRGDEVHVLEAKLTVNGSGTLLVDAKLNLDSLKELLNVSQVALAEEGGETVFTAVNKADGQKCERCWHWETDVGKHAEHSTLCGRCVKAVTER